MKKKKIIVWKRNGKGYRKEKEWKYLEKKYIRKEKERERGVTDSFNREPLILLLTVITDKEVVGEASLIVLIVSPS